MLERVGYGYISGRGKGSHLEAAYDKSSSTHSWSLCPLTVVSVSAPLRDLWQKLRDLRHDPCRRWTFRLASFLTTSDSAVGNRSSPLTPIETQPKRHWTISCSRTRLQLYCPPPRQLLKSPIAVMDNDPPRPSETPDAPDKEKMDQVSCKGLAMRGAGANWRQDSKTAHGEAGRSSNATRRTSLRGR